MSPFANHLLSTLCWPIYIAQGIYVREKALRLAPPPGPLSGTFGAGEPSINLLTIGDSSCSGVGIAHTDQSIGVQMARKLHEQNGETVAWRNSGHNSAVAGQIRDLVVPNLEPAPYTHICIMLGTNDIKNWHSVGRWKREFGGLLYALRTRFPEAKIYWHQAINMQDVPALPKPLSSILKMRVDLFNRKGAQLCLERSVVCVPPLPNVQAAGFCDDGFHANADGYDAWSDHMLEYFGYNWMTSPAVQPHRFVGKKVPLASRLEAKDLDTELETALDSDLDKAKA